MNTNWVHRSRSFMWNLWFYTFISMATATTPWGAILKHPNEHPNFNSELALLVWQYTQYNLYSLESLALLLYFTFHVNQLFTRSMLRSQLHQPVEEENSYKGTNKVVDTIHVPEYIIGLLPPNAGTTTYSTKGVSEACL